MSYRDAMVGGWSHLKAPVFLICELGGVKTRIFIRSTYALPTLVIFSLFVFDSSYPNGYELISHCGFFLIFIEI